MTRARDVANIDGLLTTTGDTFYASSGGTPARLGIGSTGNVLTVSGGVPAWSAPAGGGKVLQVVQDTLTSNFSTGSSSSVDTGLTVSITPSSATSKIYITANAASWTVGGTSTPNNYSQFALMRDATQLQLNIIGHYNGYSTSGAEDFAPLSFSYLDSPATTSSVTYKIQGKIGSSSLARIDAGATQIASIVVMEIGA